MKSTFTLALLVLFTFSGCSNTEPEEPLNDDTTRISVNTSDIKTPEKLPLVKDRKIKNLIFMIGDGTGIAQLYSGQLNLAGAAGRLNVQTMPVTGLVKTYSADNLITDSAAGATAYSCGQKTDNGMIVYLPDGTHCKTILEILKEKGLATGLVSTSGITHATPASFATHVESRNNYSEIAEQLLVTNADVYLGGGFEYFIPMEEEGSARKDDKNLIPKFEAAGYEYLSSTEELINATGDKLLGLFAPGGLPSENRTPTLAEMTEVAVNTLSSGDNGFYLMVEGSQIDWGGHANDAQYVLREVRDFDDAIKVVLDFAKEDGETLVVITADHETGGMTIQEANEDNSEMSIYWTTDHHTGVPVPLMAYGPHAIEFTGWFENTEVGIKMARLMGIEEFPAINE